MKNQTTAKCDYLGLNRTPFKEVHLAKSGEIVNDFNHPICQTNIDDNPKAINRGNAEFLMLAMNGYNDLVMFAKGIDEIIRMGKSSDVLWKYCVEHREEVIAKAEGTLMI